MFWFFPFSLISVKDSFFFSSIFFIDLCVLFMICISPLVFLLVGGFLNTNLSKKESLLYKLLFLIIIIFTNLCFMTGESFFFLFFLELTVIPMSVSILFYSKDSDKLSAVIFMLFINLAGSIPFMFFSYNLNYVYLNFSSFSLFNFNMVESFLLLFCFLFLLCSKLPVFLLHFWLTKAHVSASGSCSMILASIMLKLGSFGLIKFSNFFFLKFYKMYSSFFSVVLLGSLFLSVIMVRFIDMKYLIACSSILHMSLIFPLSLAGGTFEHAPIMFMMTGHGLVSYFLFFLVSLIYEGSFSRSFDLNKSLESMSKTIPMVIFIFSFMNLGLPPFLNFMSELFFCSSLFSYSYISLLLFGLVMLVSLIFTILFLTKFLFGKKTQFSYMPQNMRIFFYSFSYINTIFFLPFIF